MSGKKVIKSMGYNRPDIHPDTEPRVFGARTDRTSPYRMSVCLATMSGVS
jgi:hypothetical protein